MVQSAPASLAKADLVPWIVAARGYTEQKAVFATAAGSAAYDWMAMRAGQLNPDQRAAQQTACAAYVRLLANAGTGALGAVAKDIGPNPTGRGPLPESGIVEPPTADGHQVVGMGLILGWILSALVWNIVTYLFEHMFAEPKRLQAFQTMHEPN